ncbi:ATP-binding protein [Streptomyces sp. NPDC087440]|uniref:ATP-binding protein n=1 Tax=Streptomyces sp. NPDC087440 TaxID=3365790 RepID=UPI0037F9F7E1
MNMKLQHPTPREAFYRGERKSVPTARQFVTRALVEWACIERADDILLCVSELVTNALLHGVPPGRGLLLRLALDPVEARLRIEVHDSGDGDVVAAPLDPEREEGRGLTLVGLLADTWGVGERSPGKVVWCEFATQHA